jgi:hypothetical protein
MIDMNGSAASLFRRRQTSKPLSFGIVTSSRMRPGKSILVRVDFLARQVHARSSNRLLTIGGFAAAATLRMLHCVKLGGFAYLIFSGVNGFTRDRRVAFLGPRP